MTHLIRVLTEGEWLLEEFLPTWGKCTEKQIQSDGCSWMTCSAVTQKETGLYRIWIKREMVASEKGGNEICDACN